MSSRNLAALAAAIGREADRQPADGIGHALGALARDHAARISALVPEVERTELAVTCAWVLVYQWECSATETPSHRRACPGCSRADTLRDALTGSTTADSGA